MATWPSTYPHMSCTAESDPKSSPSKTVAWPTCVKQETRVDNRSFSRCISPGIHFVSLAPDFLLQPTVTQLIRRIRRHCSLHLTTVVPTFGFRFQQLIIRRELSYGWIRYSAVVCVSFDGRVGPCLRDV